MEDILIVYDSKTGNTQKVAEALAEGAGKRAKLCRYTEAPAQLDAFKAVFLGYWVDCGLPTAGMRKYLSGITGKKVVFFQTLGAEPDSQHALVSVANAAKFLPTSSMVLGVLSIRGAIDPALIARRRKLSEVNGQKISEDTENRWLAASVHPDAEDLDRARMFMQNFLEYLEKFFQ